jgi:tetratricopeptide (TPR) repeat protein
MQPSSHPRTVLDEARHLTAQGEYAEALEKYLWSHRHALEHDQAFAGVRLSFALSERFELGEKYAPARQALLSARDEAAAAIERGEGSFSLFQDVASINELLGDEEETARLFKEADRRYPDLARECYPVAEPVLAARGEYATCVRYLPALEKRLEAIRHWHRVTLQSATESRTLRSPEARLKEFAEMRLAQDTGRLIAHLRAVLHDQAGGAGDRPGPVGRLRHRPRPRRHHRGRQHARPRHRLPHPPASGAA